MTRSEQIRNFEQAAANLRTVCSKALVLPEIATDGNELVRAWEDYRDAAAAEQLRRIREANEVLKDYFARMTEIRDAQLQALKQHIAVKCVADLAGDDGYFVDPVPVRAYLDQHDNDPDDADKPSGVAFPVIHYTMGSQGAEIRLDQEVSGQCGLAVNDSYNELKLPGRR